MAAMLNSWHTAGSVTWSAFRPFDIPTRHRSRRALRNFYI